MRGALGGRRRGKLGHTSETLRHPGLGIGSRLDDPYGDIEQGRTGDTSVAPLFR